MVSRGVEGCRVGRVGMGCRGVELVSRFGVEVSRPGLSPDPPLRSPLAGVEGGSPESPRAARGSMASRWENSFVLLTLSLEVQRPGCEPSPWLSRVGAASGLSGRLAHAQPACGCPDTWPLVDLAGQGPLRLNSRPKRYYLLRPSPGTLEDCLSSQGHVLLTIFTPTMLFSHRS